jgi:hypothetical protein
MVRTFKACSICLRVQVGSQWIEAEQVIRANRTHELAAVPRLQPAVCDVCADVILSATAHELLAAA